MKNTKIELEWGYKIMPSAFEAGFPPYLWILPKGNRGHNLWEAYVKFTPKFKQILVKKKRRKKPVVEDRSYYIVEFDDNGNIIKQEKRELK